MIKKIGKWVLGTVLLLLVVLGTLFAIMHESRPHGIVGTEADALANKMLTALNYEAYKNTRFLEWSFANDRHHYMWDKEQHQVTVRWEDYTVNLHLKDTNLGEVLESGKTIDGSERVKILKKARKYFNNDSFWLVAPYKVYDPGTQRSLVTLDDGTQGLLVTYATGGDTPGDSYLWLLNGEGIPQSFKMWVNIIPIGGLEASWEGWQLTESGAWLPTIHKLGPISLGLGTVKGYN